MGPSWPNCSFVLWTWPMKSINPSPDFGTPCSGQSVNWNCLTVRDWPSFRGKPHPPQRTQGGSAARRHDGFSRKKTGGAGGGGEIGTYLMLGAYIHVLPARTMSPFTYLHGKLFLLSQFPPQRIESSSSFISTCFKAQNWPLKPRWNLYTLSKICESNHFLILKGASRPVIENRVCYWHNFTCAGLAYF